MKSKFTASLGALFALALSANAETMVVESVEWKACAADLVVTGKVLQVTGEKEPWAARTVNFSVGETLKGKLDQKEIEVRASGIDPTIDKDTEVIVFLRRGGIKYPDDVINLNAPKRVYSENMKKLGSSEEIIKAATTGASCRITESNTIDVPFDAEIFRELWGGSAVLMIVPAWPKFREHYLKLARSDIPHERAAGASQLYKYKVDDEAKQLLRDLLKDDTLSFSYYSADRYAGAEYSVRRAAYQSLKAMGEDVPEVILQRNVTEEEQRELRRRYWSKSFSEALPDGWKVSGVADWDLPDEGVSKVGDPPESGAALSIDLSDGKGTIRYLLISKELRIDTISDDASNLVYIGINGASSQGARQFLVQGDAPDDVVDRVSKYFGLEATRP